MKRIGKSAVFIALCASLAWATIAGSAPQAPPPPKIPALPTIPSPTADSANPSGGAVPTAKSGGDGGNESAPTSPMQSGAPAGGDGEQSKAPGKPTAKRYQVILVRNPFGLNPPPPPEPEEEPPPPEPDVDIYLTGISTLLGKKRAFLKTDDPKETDKDKKVRYYSLKIGEEQDQIKILEIDVDNGTVDISYKGDSQQLNFSEHGIEKKVAKAAAAKPGQPGSAGRKLPPGMTPSTSASRASTRPSVTRTTTPRPSGANPVRPNSTANRNVYNRASTRPPSVNVPTRAPRGASAGVRSVSPNGTSLQLPIRPTRSSSGPLLPPPPKVDVQEQKILMELNREVNRAAMEQLDEIMPPLPPVD